MLLEKRLFSPYGVDGEDGFLFPTLLLLLVLANDFVKALTFSMLILNQCAVNVKRTVVIGVHTVTRRAAVLKNSKNEYNKLEVLRGVDMCMCER